MSETPIRDDDEQAIRSSLELWTKQRNEIERLNRKVAEEKEAAAAYAREAVEKLTILETRVEALESERASMESRVASATLERDNARDREGLWIAFFAGIQAQFAGFDPVTLTKRKEGAEWISPDEYRHREAIRRKTFKDEDAEMLERTIYAPPRASGNAEHEGDKQRESAA